MECARCGHDNPGGAGRCEACGIDLRSPSPTGEEPLRTGRRAAAVAGAAAVAVALLIGLCLAHRPARPPPPVAGPAVPPPSGQAAPAKAAVAPQPAKPDQKAIEEPPNPWTTPPAEFRAAREKARTAACLSNLKQSGLAVLMYTMDYDEHFPRTKAWCDEVSPYIRNDTVLTCPSLRDVRGGYGYNSRLAGRELVEVRSPQLTIITFDAKGGWNVVGGADQVVPRHQKGPNVGFVDGHVKWLGPEGLGSCQWAPAEERRAAGVR